MDVVCGPLKIKLGFLWHTDYNEFSSYNSSEKFASNGLFFWSGRGLYLTLSFEEFDAFCPLESVVWVLLVL